MRALERPKPELVYRPSSEIGKLRRHRDRVHDDPTRSRHVPPVATPGHVLIASWNIANLGVHKRRPRDHKVIAELLSWYEIIAVQEIADNLVDLEAVLALLPDHFRVVFNDRAGNEERSAYIYDDRRVQLGSKVGEVVVVDSDRKHVSLPGIDRVFPGFNRNPYLVSFEVEGTRLLFANCHLYFGKSSPAAAKKASLELRQLEAFAISRWCDLRRNDRHAHTANIIALGDFNLPKAEPGDAIHDALTARGLQVPPHDSRIPTNVSRDSDYDQVAVVPGLKNNIVQMGVFDFDEVIFSQIYDDDAPAYWRRCAKYYISDHRPIWVQLRLPPHTE